MKSLGGIAPHCDGGSATDGEGDSVDITAWGGVGWVVVGCAGKRGGDVAGDSTLGATGTGALAGAWGGDLGSTALAGVWVDYLSSEAIAGAWVEDLGSTALAGAWVGDLGSTALAGAWFGDLDASATEFAFETAPWGISE